MRAAINSPSVTIFTNNLTLRRSSLTPCSCCAVSVSVQGSPRTPTKVAESTFASSQGGRMSHARLTAFFLLAALLIPLSAAAQEHPTYQVGPQPDGSFVTPTNQVVTPAGTQVNFNGRPVAVAVRPNQKTAAVLVEGGGYTLPTLPIVIVDLTTGAVKQEFNPGSINGSYDGVLYSKDGTQLYFSQDNGHVIVANVASDGTLSLHTSILIPSTLGATNNGGLALSADGKTLYVVLNMINSVGVIDLTTNQ